MKAKDLKKIISEVSKLNPSRVIVPILECFVVEDGKLIASNLDTWLIYSVPFENGLVVPISMMGKILMKLSPSDNVGIEKEGRYINIVINGKKLFNLLGDNVKDFPAVPGRLANSCGELNEKDIITIRNLARFKSTDELRPAMTGLLMDVNCFVATDGHLMGWVKHNSTTDFTNMARKSFLLDNDIFKFLDVESYLMFESGSHMTFSGSKDVVIKLIDETFPDYKNVIPKDTKMSVSINRRDLIREIEFASIASNKSTYQVIIDFSDEITIQSNDIDFENSFKNTLPALLIERHDKKCDTLKVGFNAKYFLTCLRMNGECMVTIDVGEPNRAIVFDKEFLLMPVMITAGFE